MNISKKQLTKINKFKSAEHPILETLLFDAVTVTACNLGGRKFEVPVFYQISHQIEVNGSGCIPADQFVKIARKYQIESISFDSNSKAEIVTGAGSFHIQGEHPDDFPHVPTIESDPDLSIYNDTLQSLEPFTSTDDLRPAMCGIFFDVENRAAVATNGHIMRYIDIDPGAAESFILPNTAIKLTDGKNNYNHYQAKSEAGRYGAIATPGRSEVIYFNVVDEKYPNWRGVWPKGKEQTITADKKELKKFLEAAKIAGSQTTGQIELRVENNAVQIYAGDIDTESEYKSPYFGKIERLSELGGFTAVFNSDYFLQVLKNTPGDVVTIDGESKNRAHIINNNTILMPVMLGSYA